MECVPRGMQGKKSEKAPTPSVFKDEWADIAVLLYCCIALSVAVTATMSPVQNVPQIDHCRRRCSGLGRLLNSTGYAIAALFNSVCCERRALR